MAPTIVKVRPGGFDFFEGGNAVGRFRLIVDGEPYELQADDASSSFLSGGVSYRLTVRGVEVESAPRCKRSDSLCRGRTRSECEGPC